MTLSKKEIIEWYCKYNYPEYENEIMCSINAVNTWEDFKNLLLQNHGILYWKGALRTKHYYDCLELDSSKWKELYEITKVSIKEQKETVKKIRNFSKENMKYKGKSGGISYPVASTLVFFFSKGECPVIDWRAIYTLKINGYSEHLTSIKLYPNKTSGTYQIYLEDDGWDSYFDLCKDIVRTLNIEKIGKDTPLRVLDKALWKYPDLNKEKHEKGVCL